MIQVVRVKNIKSKVDNQYAKVYRLEGIGEKEARELAEKVFSESIYQAYTLNEPIIRAQEVIEVAYKPGVMNPEVSSIMKATSDLGIKLIAADSYHEYGFSKVPTSDVLRDLLNPMIQYIVKEEPKTLVIKGTPGKTNIILLRKMSDKDLMEISKDKLFLNKDEMKIIQNYFQ